MITIGIPLYNSEKYICRCLNSILSQTFQDIEVLIVNDDCTDNSIERIQSIIKGNNTSIQIRVINQEKNLGVAIARNRAMEEAKGDYIYFLDSDDMIPPNCIEILNKTILENSCNFVVGSFCYYNENNELNKKNAIYEYYHINSNQDFFKYKYAYTKHSLFAIFVWNILFDINFLRSHNFKFKELRKGEDQIFIMELMPYITSCIILPNITYYYIQRSDSLSNYNIRTEIDTNEVIYNVNTLKYKLDIINKWNDNYYYPEIIYQQIRDAIWMLLSIFEKKAIIKPYFPHNCIKFLCKHPLPLNQIFRLKRKRMFHITFYLFSIMPLYIQEFALEFYIKVKK